MSARDGPRRAGLGEANHNQAPLCGGSATNRRLPKCPSGFRATESIRDIEIYRHLRRLPAKVRVPRRLLTLANSTRTGVCPDFATRTTLAPLQSHSYKCTLTSWPPDASRGILSRETPPLSPVAPRHRNMRFVYFTPNTSRFSLSTGLPAH